jgi:Fe-S oxidoreductase
MFKKYFREIEFCTYCPKMCKFCCPVGNASGVESYSPWGRMTLLHMVREGIVDFNREIAYTMYQCTGCMLCREHCDHLIEVPPVMIAAREKAAIENKLPWEVVEYLKFWKQHQNPFGDNLSARVKTLLPESYFNQDAQVMYLPGAGHIYNNPSVIQDTFKLFEAMDIDYVACYDGDPIDCGTTLRELGLRKEYEANAAKLADKIGRCKVVISGSPAVVYELKVEFEQMGLKVPPKVFHIAEFLWPMVKDGRFDVRKQFPQRVMYHDADYLGRYLGVYDEPRSILGAVLREAPVEFSRNREKADSCGANGGLPITNPDLAKEIAKARLAEFYESDATALAVACPDAQRIFQSVDDNIEVLDVINILARCI